MSDLPLTPITALRSASHFAKPPQSCFVSQLGTGLPCFSRLVFKPCSERPLLRLLFRSAKKTRSASNGSSGPGQHAELGRRHRAPPVVVRVEREHDAVAVRDRPQEPLDGVGVARAFVLS